MDELNPTQIGDADYRRFPDMTLTTAMTPDAYTDAIVIREVLERLLDQGKRSTRVDDESGGEQCAYRGDGGTACAVGLLATDAEMAHLEEGSTFDLPIVRELLDWPATDIPRPILGRWYVLRTLQRLHDLSHSMDRAANRRDRIGALLGTMDYMSSNDSTARLIETILNNMLLHNQLQTEN